MQYKEPKVGFIKKHIEFFSLLLSIAAIVMAALSYLQSKSVEERTIDIEIHSQLKEISEDLKLEFRSDSLYFTTLKPCPDETLEEKKARLTNVAIGIRSLEALVKDRDKDMIVFLKTVLLAQQGDYEAIDNVLQQADGEYKRSLKDLKIKYKTCIPREESA